MTGAIAGPTIHLQTARPSLGDFSNQRLPREAHYLTLLLTARTPNLGRLAFCPYFDLRRHKLRLREPAQAGEGIEVFGFHLGDHVLY